MPEREPSEHDDGPEAAGRRLDQALASLFPDYSRTRLKSWIDEGKVLVDGRRRGRATAFHTGEEFFTADVADMIAAEYRWTLAELAKAGIKPR